MWSPTQLFCLFEVQQANSSEGKPVGFFFKHLNISLIKTSWMVTDFLTEMPDWLNRWNKYAN